MDQGSLKQITALMASYKDLKLAYFFGSRARGDEGPLSDYDFAIHLEDMSVKKAFEIRVELMAKIGLILKSDHIDVVVLTKDTPPELAYHVIVDGQLIHEVEPYKIIVEPRILNRFFDFRMSLRKNNLTAA